MGRKSLSGKGLRVVQPLARTVPVAVFTQYYEVRTCAACRSSPDEETASVIESERRGSGMADERRGEGGEGKKLNPWLPGIVIADGRALPRALEEPRITAFIWGGKVRPTPTLPFGRWKGAA